MFRRRFANGLAANTVFRVDPESGRIFFGQPEQSADGKWKPRTGLMYNPADETLSSKDRSIVIDADGTITVTDGSFSGSINALTGFFGGQIDCPSFSSLPASGTEIVVDMPTGASAQYDTLYDALYSQLTEENYYECTHSLNSDIKYVRWDMDGTGHYYFYFYDESRIEVARIYSHTEWWNTSFESPWASSTFTVTVRYGLGDVFVLKDIPTEPNGLKVGQVWRDGSTLKIVT